MQSIGLCVVVAAAGLAAGCNKGDIGRVAQDVGRQMEPAFEQAGREIGREVVSRELGPAVLASLVGWAAPPGGPLGLVGAEAGWRQWSADILLHPTGIRSPLEPAPPGFGPTRVIPPGP